MNRLSIEEIKELKDKLAVKKGSDELCIEVLKSKRNV